MVSLICISLKSNDIKHISICFLPILYILFGDVPVNSFVLKKLSFINLNMFFTYLEHESFVGHMQDFGLCFHSIVYIKE